MACFYTTDVTSFCLTLLGKQTSSKELPGDNFLHFRVREDIETTHLLNNVKKQVDV